MRAPKQVAIIGFGLIGASIALALRSQAQRVNITAFDRALVRKRARARYPWLSVASSLRKAVLDSDLVILSAPLLANITFLRRLCSTQLADRSLVIDVGSTKESIVSLARTLTLSSGAEFIGTHPMAGRELSGFAHAQSKLFAGKPWFVDSSRPLSQQNRDKLAWLLRCTGATRVDIKAGTHDMLMAELSHLPQLLSTLLAAQMPEKLLPLAGTGLHTMLRLSGSDYVLWQDILRDNNDNILESLKLFRKNLDILIASTENRESLASLFRAANRRYACLS